MSNLAPVPGLTLAPFQRLYGDVQEILLTDSFYAVPEAIVQRAPRAEPEARVPQVIRLPNRARFEAAVDQWMEDIEFDSLPDEMKAHASFNAIVEDQTAVVPLIAAHLRRKPSFLFLALEEIFQEDPVPEDAYGNLQTTVSAWLRWLQH